MRISYDEISNLPPASSIEEANELLWIVRALAIKARQGYIAEGAFQSAAASDAAWKAARTAMKR